MARGATRSPWLVVGLAFSIVSLWPFLTNVVTSYRSPSPLNGIAGTERVCSWPRGASPKHGIAGIEPQSEWAMLLA